MSSTHEGDVGKADVRAAKDGPPRLSAVPCQLNLPDARIAVTVDDTDAEQPVREVDGGKDERGTSGGSRSMLVNRADLAGDTKVADVLRGIAAPGQGEDEYGRQGS